jgi:hypothetical protein
MEEQKSAGGKEGGTDCYGELTKTQALVPRACFEIKGLTGKSKKPLKQWFFL